MSTTTTTTTTETTAAAAEEAALSTRINKSPQPSVRPQAGGFRRHFVEASGNMELFFFLFFPVTDKLEN